MPSMYLHVPAVLGWIWLAWIIGLVHQVFDHALHVLQQPWWFWKWLMDLSSHHGHPYHLSPCTIMEASSVPTFCPSNTQNCTLCKFNWPSTWKHRQAYSTAVNNQVTLAALTSMASATSFLMTSNYQLFSFFYYCSMDCSFSGSNNDWLIHPSYWW